MSYVSYGEVLFQFAGYGGGGYPTYSLRVGFSLEAPNTSTLFFYGSDYTRAGQGYVVFPAVGVNYAGGPYTRTGSVVLRNNSDLEVRDPAGPGLPGFSPFVLGNDAGTGVRSAGVLTLLEASTLGLYSGLLPDGAGGTIGERTTLLAGEGSEGDGRVLVRQGSTLFSSGYAPLVVIGSDGGYGSLTVNSNSVVSGFDLVAARGAQATGRVTVDGTDGPSRLVLTDSGVAYPPETPLEEAAGGFSTATAPGASAVVTVTNGSAIEIFNDPGSGREQPFFALAEADGSTGFLTISGTDPTFGPAALRLEQIGQNDSDRFITGATLTVGGDGYGSALVQAGGEIEILGPGATLIVSRGFAGDPAVADRLVIENSTVTVDSFGYGGQETFDYFGGGTLDRSFGSAAYIGLSEFSNGYVRVNGSGALNVVSQSTVPNDYSSGVLAVGNVGQGELRVTGGAEVNARGLGIGRFESGGYAGDGLVVVEAGSVSVEATEGTPRLGLRLGESPGAIGRLELTTDQASVASTGGAGLVVVGGYGGTGEIVAEAGSTIDANRLEIANDTEATGTVTLTGATATLSGANATAADRSAALLVGNFGSGALSLANGATVLVENVPDGAPADRSGAILNAASGPDSDAAITVDGSSLSLVQRGQPLPQLPGADVRLGDGGPVSLAITGGGSIDVLGAAPFFEIGYGFNAPGPVESTLRIEAGSTLRIDSGSYGRDPDFPDGQGGIYTRDLGSSLRIGGYQPGRTATAEVTGIGASLLVTSTSNVEGDYATGGINVRPGSDLLVNDGGYVFGRSMNLAAPETTLRVENAGAVTVAGESGAIYAGVNIGGYALVSGEGSVLTSTANTGGTGLLRVSDTDGGGALRVENGAAARGFFIEIARGRYGSTPDGRLFVDGPGASLRSSDAYGAFDPAFGPYGGFVSLGREGGTARAYVTDGATLDIANAPASIADLPVLQLGRGANGLAGYGYLFVGTDDGSGDLSTVNLALTGPSNDGYLPGTAYGPRLRLGRDGGQGEIVVGEDGRLNVTGEDSLVRIGQDGGIGGGIAPESSLTILDGGRMRVESLGAAYGAEVVVGENAGASGRLALMGATARLDVLTQLTGGADGSGITIGREGTGVMTVMGGATVAVDSVDDRLPFLVAGEAPGSDGRIVVDGAGSSLTVSGADTAGVVDGALIEIGREGFGSLIVSGGAAVANEPADAAGTLEFEAISFIGRKPGSEGVVLVDGAASTFGAGDLLLVGADREPAIGGPFDNVGGAGTLSLAGGTVDALQVWAGDEGRVTGEGTITGRLDIFSGTLDPGGAGPGTLRVEGAQLFAGFGSTVLLDVEGFGPGEADRLEAVTGSQINFPGIEIDFPATVAPAGSEVALVSAANSVITGLAAAGFIEKVFGGTPPVGPSALLPGQVQAYLLSDTQTELALAALPFDGTAETGAVDFGAATTDPLFLDALNGYGAGFGGGTDLFALYGVTAVAGTAAADDLDLETTSALTLEGRAGDDTLSASLGDDLLDGGEGDDLLTGDAGEDIARYAGERAGYTVEVSSDAVIVTDSDFSDGDEGTDTLSGIEILRFADGDFPVAPLGNEPPVSDPDVYDTGFGETLEVAAADGVLANDSDPDGDPITAVLVDGTAGGSVALAPDGGFTYVPDPGFSGTDVFRYRANDGALDGPVTEVAIEVAPNGAPVAPDDSFETAEDTPLTVPLPGVLANDSDPEGGALTASLVSQTSDGTVTLAPDGAFTYAPAADFFGTDSFVYAVEDPGGASAEGTVTIAVTPVEDLPRSRADAYATGFRERLEVGAAAGVLANDTDADGDALTAVLVEGVAGGTLELNTDGSFVYVPDSDFSGSDGFRYAADDGTGQGPAVEVTIAVGANASPDAGDDRFETFEDTALSVDPPGLLANDSDPDGDPLRVSLVTGPASGSVSVADDGAFTYEPDPDFFGIDSFVYAVDDGVSAPAEATATVEVRAVNDRPAPGADAYATGFGEVLEVEAAEGVLANDTDRDGDALTTVLVDAPLSGTVALAADGSFVYRPAEGFSGADSFTYRPSDGTLEGPVTIVSLSVAANGLPVAEVDTYALDEDGILEVDPLGVLANDADPDGDLLAAALLAGPANGSLELEPDGAFRYEPAPDFAGPDSFTYQLSDGRGGLATGSVVLEVAPVNDAPAGAEDNYATPFGTRLAVQAAEGVLANDADVDDPREALGVELVAPPASGEVTLRPDGSFDYVPAEGFSGADGFTYRVSDGALTSGEVAVTLTVGAPGNTAPAAEDDRFQTAAGETLVVPAIGVLENDTDAEGDVLAAALAEGGGPANGTLTLAPDGGFTYAPEPGFAGTDRFVYEARDGAGGTDTAEVEIVVTPPNRAPEARPDRIGADSDTTASGNLLADNGSGPDTDPDGDALTVTAIEGAAAGIGNPVALASGAIVTVRADGSFDYAAQVPQRPAPGEGPSVDSFSYTVADGRGGTSTAVAEIVFPEIDAPPDARDDRLFVLADRTLSADVLADNGAGADRDPNGGPLAVVSVEGAGAGVGTPVTLASGAAVTLGADGALLYDPNAAFGGLAGEQTATDSFTYTVADETGATATATVTVTVEAPEPSAPVDGTEEDDVLVVESARDQQISAGDGDDRIAANSGDDRIDGGPGNDLIAGGDGENLLIGGPGDDVIRVGNGPDRVIFGIEQPGDEPVIGRDLLVGTLAALDGTVLEDYRSNDEIGVLDGDGGFLEAVLLIGGGAVRIDVGGDGTVEATIFVDDGLSGIGSAYTGPDPFDGFALG